MRTARTDQQLLGARGPRTDTAQLDELTYLLEPGSDRAGALDFQTSATQYVPRQGTNGFAGNADRRERQPEQNFDVPAAAHQFLLSRDEAMEIAQRQVAEIAEHWDAVCEEAAISKTDRTLLATRQFLNPFSVEGTEMDKIQLD